MLRSFVRDGDPERLAAALAPGLDEPDAPPPPPPPAPLLPDPGAGPPRRPFLPPTLQDDPNALGLFPTERPATKMKTFPWSKVNPDLNGEPLGFEWGKFDGSPILGRAVVFLTTGRLTSGMDL